MVEFLNSIPLGWAILIGLLAFALLVFVAYWVAMGIPMLLVQSPKVRYYHVKTLRFLNRRVKVLKKVISIPKEQIYKKNKDIYELMRNMRIETDSLEFLVSKSDCEDYFNFLFYKFTATTKEVRVTAETSLFVNDSGKKGHEDVYFLTNSNKEKYCWCLKYRHDGYVDKLILTRMS